MLTSSPEPAPPQLVTEAGAEAENAGSEERLTSDSEHKAENRCASDPRSRLGTPYAPPVIPSLSATPKTKPTRHATTESMTSNLSLIHISEPTRPY